VELRKLQQHWDAFGEQDPLWAVLTAPGKRGGGWDVDEFFATGRQDVEQALGALAERGIAIERDRALDFGCGVGRLTRALAAEFASCDGVDVAASMVDRARELNLDGDRVRFHHNDAPDLRLFADGSFDFILALIVLQHMRPELMRGYLHEFVRLLRPSGVAFFSIPEWYLAGEELPAEASRALLTLIGSVPELAPGEIGSLKLSVRNDSPVRWPGSTQLHVGDHWLRADGSMVIRDDARTAIFATVEPGDECEVQLDIVAPRESGRYQLEVDLVQESVGWFADRGSPTLRVPVVVAPTSPAVGDGARPAVPHAEATRRAALTPKMEMYVMARGDVAATIEEAGGAVLDVIPRDRCGPWFPSADYVVARATSPLRRTASAITPPAPQSADPWFDERRRHAQRVMDQRLDLVDFRLTSTRRHLGRASVLARTTLRRAMYQVLRRQTEFNRAVSQLIRSHGAQLDELAELERRVARLETGEVGQTPGSDAGAETPDRD
jgi:SAM-dependent methyltransferase